MSRGGDWKPREYPDGDAVLFAEASLGAGLEQIPLVKPGEELGRNVCDDRYPVVRAFEVVAASAVQS